MRHLSKALNNRLFLRLAAAGMTAAMLSGCSSDASRFNNAFSNPFASKNDMAPTGTIPEQDAPAYRPPGYKPSQVSSRPLPAPGQAAAVYAAPARVSPRTAYNVPPVPAPAATASIARPALASSRANGWSAEGGTPVVVAQGETSAMLARRYGVPEDALLRTNGFGSAAQVQPGARLVVPVFSNGNSASNSTVTPRQTAPARVAKAADPEAVEPAPQPVKTKARQAAKPAPASAKPVKLAQAIKPAPAKQAVLVKPAPVKQVAAANPAQPAKTVAVAPKPVPVKTAKAQTPVVTDPKKPDIDKTPVAALPPQTATADTANPEFRWPARGRIIQGFKAGGNDGINIAVPEGTSVKAAEGGVVAYAGSELKGYGNLVLIRHPNGFVSAYANNGDLDVKRGDTVKRGQTIAKSGQSGNVSSPQLHFELRKGSTPVDPTNYLAGL